MPPNGPVLSCAPADRQQDGAERSLPEDYQPRNRSRRRVSCSALVGGNGRVADMYECAYSPICGGVG